jgi:hypothetical protein
VVVAVQRAFDLLGECVETAEWLGQAEHEPREGRPRALVRYRRVTQRPHHRSDLAPPGDGPDDVSLRVVRRVLVGNGAVAW